MFSKSKSLCMKSLGIPSTVNSLLYKATWYLWELCLLTEADTVKAQIDGICGKSVGTVLTDIGW